MSNKNSGIWSIMLPLSVVILGAAYYIKMPAVRQAIDARTSVVHDLLGRFVAEPEVHVVKKETPPYIPSYAEPVREVPPAPRKVPVAMASVSTTPTPVPAPVPIPVAPAPPAAFDLQKLSSDHTLWPKKVALAKPATFPAVLNGKQVGSLVVPAGTETELVAIQNGKLGLKFNDGGAWLNVEDTDLIARVQSH